MKQKTKDDYQKLAEHFYRKYLSREPTFKQVKEALIREAPNFRPAYWRRLKNAIRYDQKMKGWWNKYDFQKFEKLKNPTTDPASNHLKPKSKQRRVKALIKEDLDLLIEAVIESEDHLMLAALRIAFYVGCRPNEMPKITFHNGIIHIPASKVTDLRGADRWIEIKDRKTYEKLQQSVGLLKEAQKGSTTKSPVIELVQRRLQYTTKKLWPRRKHRISLYSFRHQLGSDLKSSGLPAETVAYFMGHQSTKSVAAYGDRRCGAFKRKYLNSVLSVEDLKINIRNPSSSSHQIDFEKNAGLKQFHTSYEME